MLDCYVALRPHLLPCLASRWGEEGEVGERSAAPSSPMSPMGHIQLGIIQTHYLYCHEGYAHFPADSNWARNFSYSGSPPFCGDSCAATQGTHNVIASTQHTTHKVGSACRSTFESS